MKQKYIILWLILSLVFFIIFWIYPPQESAHVTLIGLRMSAPLGLSVICGIIIYFSTRKSKTYKR